MRNEVCLNCVHLCTGCIVIQTCNLSIGQCRLEGAARGSISDPEKHGCTSFTEMTLADEWRGTHPSHSAEADMEEYPFPSTEEDVGTFVSFG